MSEIYWLNPISGSFTNAAYWSGGVVPGAADDAILDAVGASPYTVTASTAVSVNSIQTAPDASLSIAAGTFTVAAGTGFGTNAGIILVAAGATLATAGQIANTGAIEINSGALAGSLLLAGSTELTGGGQIELESSSKKPIINVVRHHSFFDLTNVDNTISGSGLIEGRGNFSIINDAGGVIDANGAKALIIDADFENDGLIEASGTGGLTLNAQFQSSGSGGVLLASNDSEIRFEKNTLIVNATLESEGNGHFIAYGGEFEGLTNKSDFIIPQYTPRLDDVVNNMGIISAASEFRTFDILLSGGGVVNLGTSGSIYATGQFYNMDNIILGGEGIFASMRYSETIVNESFGVIEGRGAGVFQIKANGGTITNYGTIESTGTGGLTTDGSLDNVGLLLSSAGTLTLGLAGAAYVLANTGTIAAAGGTIIANMTVVGNGRASISAGILEFTSAFDETVSFTGSTGTLELAHSEDYSKTVSGFSKTGGTSLDLNDISFVNASEATFSGTIKGGLLRVTDGTHTASIDLKGNYLKSTFVTSSDGHGGTDVVAQNVRSPAAPIQAFIETMAGFGARGGQILHADMTAPARQFLLTTPRAAIA